MTLSLKTQKRLAADILKVGKNRVWLDPERTEDIEVALTRTDIRQLINDKVIEALPEKGISRSRARLLHEKRKIGRRRGPGNRKGKSTTREPRKVAWMMRIRAQRRRLKNLKNERSITKKTYRLLYRKSKGGSFRDLSRLEDYLKTNNLVRRR